jgi:hypothetical protein
MCVGQIAQLDEQHGELEALRVEDQKSIKHCFYALLKVIHFIGAESARMAVDELLRSVKTAVQSLKLKFVFYHIIP